MIFVRGLVLQSLAGQPFQYTLKPNTGKLTALVKSHNPNPEYTDYQTTLCATPEKFPSFLLFHHFLYCFPILRDHIA